MRLIGGGVSCWGMVFATSFADELDPVVGLDLLFDDFVEELLIESVAAGFDEFAEPFLAIVGIAF